MGTRDAGTFWNMNGKGMVLACPQVEARRSSSRVCPARTKATIQTRRAQRAVAVPSKTLRVCDRRVASEQLLIGSRESATLLHHFGVSERPAQQF